MVVMTKVRRADVPTSKALAAEEKRAVLNISVFGRVAVTFAGQEVRIKSRKSRAVLAYIALNDARIETRERLVGLFWSDSDEQHARASLRQTLRELRQSFLQIGYRGLQAEKLTIELDRDSLELDLWAVMREADAERAHPLLLQTSRLADRLLEDIDDVDPEFHSWVLAKRRTIHDRLVRALEDALRDDAVDRNARKQLAEALVSLDPTHEEACRNLMRARAEEGDISAALRAYNTLWNLLGDEYDMEPSAKTQQLVAEIKQGEIEITSAPIALDASGLPVTQPQHTPEPDSKPASKIALLLNSFDVNGVGPDKIYLVQGFRHHLIACLVRFREWIVADNVAQISPSANAPTISSFYSIDATAYQIKDVANVVLTLRDNGSGRYVWSENFELNLEKWFESQQRIVRRIAISLNVQLPTERLMRLAGEPDISLASYDRWLRGQALIIGFSPDNWDRATQLFEDTIREAPTFSPAYSSLVQMNNAVHFVHPGILRDQENERKTLDLARSAVQLDPVDSRAQLCLGWACAMSKQYVQAEIHMDLARELNENDSWTLTSAALFNAFCGRIAHAQSLARQSLEVSLSPTPTQWAYHAMVRFLCGDYAGVIGAADRSKDVIKTMPGWRAAALFHLGRGDEAREDGQRLLALIRSRWFGSQPATDEAIGRWLLHCHPISSPESWERLRVGLQHAGIPSGDMRHHEW